MDNENTNIIQHTLTIKSPIGSIVKINGDVINQITIDENKRIEISVFKTGYKTYEEVITNLTEDTTIDVTLELLKHKITIVTDEENTVIINGQETKELEIDEFTKVNISVSKNGYITNELSYDKITEDIIENIVLDLKYHTLKINIPEGCEFTHNLDYVDISADKRLATIIVDEFTPISYTISKPGYKNHTVYIESVKTSEIFEEPILEYETFSVTINSGKNCKGAKLFVNSKQEIFGNTIEIGTVGSEAIIEVRKEHYITYLETITLTENIILTVDLEEKTYSISVENIPEDSEITYIIGNKNKKYNYSEPFNVKSGSKVIIIASKTNYKPFIYTIDSIDKDYAIRIPKMELQKFNLTVNVPEGSNIKINGTETNYFPQIFDINSYIKIEVSKDHYISHIHEFEITEDTVYNCTLDLEQYRLTVTSNPENANIIIIDGSEQYSEREVMLDYASNVIIKAELEGYEPAEKEIQILRDTTENIVLEKKKVQLNIVTEPMSILNGALIKVDDIQINDNKAKVNYGEVHLISVEKYGYKTFVTEITPFKDTIIYINGNGKWLKPIVSVTINNYDELVSKPIILINDLPINNGNNISINYDTDIKIDITADGYFPISETKHITEDYCAIYDLVDINSGKYYISIDTDLEDAEIYINDNLVNNKSKIYFEPDTEIFIEIKHTGYETLTDNFILTENKDLTYSKDLFNKKIFRCRWYTNPSTSIVKINDIILEQKYIDVPYNTELNYSILCDKYLPQSGTIIVKKDSKVSVTLKQDPAYINKDDELEDIYGEGLDGIIRMIKIKACYSYLNIGRYFNEGLNESSINKFYKEFGFYVNSRFDYLLWRKMHDYFGHDDNIQEPEPDNY